MGRHFYVTRWHQDVQEQNTGAGSGREIVDMEERQIENEAETKTLERKGLIETLETKQLTETLETK